MKKFIKLQEVIYITGLSKGSIYAGLKKGTFPKQVSIGKRSVGWVEQEIQAWIDGRIANRDSLAI